MRGIKVAQRVISNLHIGLVDASSAAKDILRSGGNMNISREVLFMQDQYGRDIHYLRLSITDKCNLRCQYCMPDGIIKCAHEDLLTYEQMVHIISIMAELGIDTVRITGGEPLVRKGVEWLIRSVKEIDGIRKVSITTNGVLLAGQLDRLVEAGLDSVNISLDTLKPDRFHQITGFDQLEQVKKGIRAARDSSLAVKINCVPQKGVNEDELLELAKLAENHPLEVRFIEMMPLGEGKYFGGMNNQELLAYLTAHLGTMTRVESRQGAGPAVCYQPTGFAGSIGLISAMHGKFCGECNRVRLTSKGFLKGCLASGQGLELRPLMLQNCSDAILKQHIQNAIWNKPIEHHFENPSSMTENREMFRIGG